MWLDWLRRWVSRKQTKQVHRKSKRVCYRPQLEMLEDRVAPATLSTLATFNPFPNGAHPYAGLVLDSSGNLFGTTYQGGASDAGTVFEVAAGSGTITTLDSFNYPNGAFPTAGLVLDSSGNL